MSYESRSGCLPHSKPIQTENVEAEKSRNGNYLKPLGGVRKSWWSRGTYRWSRCFPTGGGLLKARGLKGKQPNGDKRSSLFLPDVEWLHSKQHPQWYATRRSKSIPDAMFPWLLLFTPLRVRTFYNLFEHLAHPGWVSYRASGQTLASYYCFFLLLGKPHSWKVTW